MPAGFAGVVNAPARSSRPGNVAIRSATSSVATGYTRIDRSSRPPSLAEAVNSRSMSCGNCVARRMDDGTPPDRTSSSADGLDHALAGCQVGGHPLVPRPTAHGSYLVINLDQLWHHRAA
jgi:hypothetical protein